MTQECSDVKGLQGTRALKAKGDKTERCTLEKHRPYVPAMSCLQL